MASADILRAARYKIADPTNWTQDFVARDDRGLVVSARSKHARSWCALGALESVTKSRFDGGDAYELLSRAARTYFDTPLIAEVNNFYGHDAVLKIYDAAIADAEAEAR